MLDTPIDDRTLAVMAATIAATLTDLDGGHRGRQYIAKVAVAQARALVDEIVRTSERWRFTPEEADHAGPGRPAVR